MARIVITSGPTRQFLDPVRYLTNASSGRMGAALATAAIAAGHDTIVVSGPVQVRYPPEAHVVPVVTTEEMLAASAQEFAKADGLIGAAAPCDYRPRHIAEGKIAKTGGPLRIELVETEDIVATLAAKKQHRWVVGFALETSDHRFRALAKLQRKCCDLIVSNAATAIDSARNAIEILAPDGEVVHACEGTKEEIGHVILGVVEARLVGRSAVT